jgi:hypothetical protein
LKLSEIEEHGINDESFKKIVGFEPIYKLT